MFVKLIVVLSVIVSLNNAHQLTGDHHHHHPDEHFIKELCNSETDPAACTTIADKCLFTSPSGASPTFCSCMTSVSGVSSIYSTWVHFEHDGVDLCVKETHGGSYPEAHGGDHHISFQDYLKNQNAALETQLDCCVGKARGLFDSSGKAIVTAWTENTSQISDATAKTAARNSITHCASTSTACSPHDFIHCVLENCYQNLKQHHELSSRCHMESS